jgi:hypothetical protein
MQIHAFIGKRVQAKKEAAEEARENKVDQKEQSYCFCLELNPSQE